MFAVGDKVVRVKPVLEHDVWLAMAKCLGENESPVTVLSMGGVYTVTGQVKMHDGTFAILVDGEAPHTCSCCDGATGWCPEGFRKIQPCEPEFIELLNRIKPKVDV